LKEKALEALEVGLGGVEIGEEAFFGLELTGVNAAAAGFDADGVLEVEHLVVEEVLDGAAGSVGTVEDAGDDDGVVSGVVVAEHAAGVVSGPRECGTAEEAVEEAGVEGFEDLVEIVVAAGRCGETLAAAGLADVLGLFGDGFGGDVAAVAVGVEARDGFSVELGEEDVGDRVMDVVGCGFEDVGEANVEATFAQTNGGVERGEAAETDVERWDWGAGTEFAVLVLEDRDEGCGGGDFFGTGLLGAGRLERCCGNLLEESWGWCWRRRKELQELAQG
jgi:hypothetical protein